MISIIFYFSFSGFFLFFFEPSSRESFISDDFYYYLVLARNYEKFGFITSDGFSTTNGFHPLYLLYLIFIYNFSGLSENAIQILSHLLMHCLIIGSGVIGYLIIKNTIRNNFISLLFLLIWVSSPLVFFISKQGVETPLALFFFSLFLYLFVKLLNSENKKLYFFILLGVFGALSFLSRSDTIIPIFLCFLFYLYKNRRIVLSKDQIKKFMLSFLFFLILISPWFVYSYLNFGSFMQESGKVLSYRETYNHQNLAKMTNLAVWPLKFLSIFGSILLFPLIFINFPSFSRKTFLDKKNIGNLLMFFCCFLSLFLLPGFYFDPIRFAGSNFTDFSISIMIFLFCVILLVKLFKPATSYDFRNCWFFALLGFAMAFFYIFYISHFQIWYILTPSFLILISLILVSRRQILSFSSSSRFILCFLIVISGFLTSYLILINKEESDFFEKLKELELRFDDSLIIGSFDSGRLSFFSSFNVVNLDGVVNHQAALNIYNHSLDQYILKRNITAIYSSLERISLYKNFMNCTELFQDTDLPYLFLINSSRCND